MHRSGRGRYPKTSECLALLLLVAGTAPRSIAQGQIVIQVAPDQAAPAAPDAEGEEADNAAAQPAAPVFMMGDETFDQWVFGGPRNTHGGHNKLDTLLNLQVEDVARTCRLSDLEKKKMVLAGRGDIKRFFDRVEEKRKKFDKVKNDQNKVNEIYQELVPLQAALNSGLFNDGSLYTKTLKKVLNDEDSARYQRIVLERRRFRYRAKVELVVAQLEQSVGFRDEQRRKLVDLIVSETEPPIRFGQYDYYLVMYQAGKIPESTLKPLFDDQQWGFVNRHFDGMRGMEQFLKNQGLLPPRDEALVAKEDKARGIADAFAKALREPAGSPELPTNVFTPAPGGH